MVEAGMKSKKSYEKMLMDGKLKNAKQEPLLGYVPVLHLHGIELFGYAQSERGKYRDLLR